MNGFLENFANIADLQIDILNATVRSLAIGIVLLGCRYIVVRLVRKKIQDIKRHYQWNKVINYTTGFLFFLSIGGVWFKGLEDISTFLGLLSAGLAIALHDLLANLAGWMFILTRSPFVVGDRIEFDGVAGDVIDISLFQTFVLECGNWVDADQSTGRIISIPNGAIFKKPLSNATGGFDYIWEEIPVLVTFESDWKKAKRIMNDIARDVAAGMSDGAAEKIRKAASTQMIYFRKVTPIVYTNVKDSGILLTMRYLTHPRQRRGNAEKIWESLLDSFADESSIDFAYPTIRSYQNAFEGKEDARASWPTGATLWTQPGQ
jgi:small-conductance mechanosensitive channel